jgi:adhesin/invasin
VETPSAGVAVTVDQTAATAASASLSTVSAAPQTLAANGVAQATASVTVKNSFGNPLSGKTVTLSSSRPADSVQPAYATTDTNGLATFTIKSLSAGESTLTASVGTIILNQKPTLTFTAVIFSAGDLIKSAGSSATYYYSSNGLKYIFPTAGIYSSWYSDFSSVKTIFAAELSAVPTSGNVTVRPGKLVQFVSMDTPWRVMDPKVYAVSQGGVLHWIKTADVARTIFGANWEKQIIAVPEVFETNYTLGTDVVAVSDYNLTAAQAVATIDQDKNL